MQLTTMRHTLNLPSSEVWIVRYEIIPAKDTLSLYPSNKYKVIVKYDDADGIQ